MPRAGGGPEDPSPLDRAVRAMFGEPGLWPVLVVCVLVLATFIAGAVLLALRAGSVPAAIAVGALVLSTFALLDADIRRRRLGPGSAAVLGVWLASAIIAAGLSYLGAF